jgi:ABC-type transport system involved in multi-copper enzyme maturation permease subunit
MSESPAASVPPRLLAPVRWPVRADFPGWFPPMLVKELRQGLRTRGFIGSFVVFHLVMVIAFVWTIEITDASGLRGAFNSLNGFFWTLLGAILLLIGPMRAVNSLREEIDHRTLDLLVLSRLSAWRIVLGKWGSLLAQLGLIVLTALPYGVLRYFFGSVDLAGDLRILGGMFFASAVLCAAGTWASTLPKVFRVIIPIALVLSFQGLGVSRVLSSAASGRASSPFPTFSSGSWSQVVFGLVVLTLFLLLSVRRLAPPAENHSLMSRLLALGVLLLGGLLGGSGRMQPEHAFAFILMMVVIAIELSEDRLPMSVHLPDWLRRNRAGRAVGLALLPGWPSAAIFMAAVLGGLALLVLAGGQALRIDVGRAAWVLVLGWQALVAPALIVSFLPRHSSMRLGSGGYFAIQGMFGIISIVAATSNLATLATGNALEWLSHVLPMSSFWLGLTIVSKRAFTGGELAGQLLALAVVLWLCWRQSLLYRESLARIRRGPDVPASAP